MVLKRKDWQNYPGSFHERLCSRFNLGISAAFDAPLTLDTDQAEVAGLFLLLDKGYSAGLRRSNGSAEDIVKKIYANKRTLKRFEALASFDEKILSRQNLPQLIRKVDEFCDLLRSAGGGKKRPLSFSSKFLHFRSKGIVPIWDSIARDNLRVVLGRKSFSDYEEFANAFFELLVTAHEKDVFSAKEIKQMDNYLIS